MKAVILAGGLGTRLSEETHLKPKPMVEIGGRPILWHIMKIYSYHGINDFIVCCGYKGYLIKEYFVNYALHLSDITVNLLDNTLTFHEARAEPWRVTLVDTGEGTQTGGRLRRVRDYLTDQTFCLTYGDGVADVDISKLVKYHYQHKKLATMTTTYPPGRFGAVELQGDVVKSFIEKPRGDSGLINAGFFVLDTKVIDYIEDDNTVWEHEPLKKLAGSGELMSYFHDGFWQPMDTLRDKTSLNEKWMLGRAPWKVW